MDWNGNLRMPFASRADQNSFSFLYNYNYDQFPELEMKQASTTLNPTFIDKNNNNNDYGPHDPKKKRLSTEQLESLENSFQEEIKLDPDRKMKLAKELGLQPRQIAVWFQNRRARWKGKQLEQLYDALKQEYDAVSRDKEKLQQEVLALRTILKEQVVGKKQVVSTGHTEISGEETVESTSSDKTPATTTNINNQMAECSFHVLNVDDYNPVMMPPPPYWSAMP